VREAHFGPVDGAIASAFDDGEDIMVLRIENDALNRGLPIWILLVSVSDLRAWIYWRTLRASSVPAMMPRQVGIWKLGSN
jgi:hypothetical protein